MPKSDAPIPAALTRIARFEQLGYGLFLHWGIYSLLGRGEWVLHRESIPLEEYRELAKTFDAKDFDARAIARLARESGMRYITLTTRHHDGFSLYDTRGLNTWDAPHSAAGRDLVAEFVEGCRAEGIVPFFYHTTLDWTWDSARCDDEKFEEYLQYLNASVEILCRNYGPIGGLWFDGNWSRKKADWKEDRLYATIRRHQPEAIIVNNTGMGATGNFGHPEIDSLTYEQDLPRAVDRRGHAKYVAGEMCQTMNRHWGIGGSDYNYLSPANVIENLCLSRKVGANYLLNVGPTAGGAIPDYEAAALRLTGRWIGEAGDLIYNAKPASITASGRDFVLTNDGRWYWFVFDLSSTGSDHVTVNRGTAGAGPRTLQGLPLTAKTVQWLDNGEALEFVQSTDGKLLTANLTGYPYGSNRVVRIAEIS